MYVLRSIHKESKVGVKFAEVWDEIMTLLPNRTVDVFKARRFASCAIVGNSGNLMMNHYGDEIDGHDAVFRFNGVSKLLYSLAASPGQFAISVFAEVYTCY